MQRALLRSGTPTPTRSTSCVPCARKAAEASLQEAPTSHGGASFDFNRIPLFPPQAQPGLRLQAKAESGAASDTCEQEADRIAERVSDQGGKGSVGACGCGDTPARAVDGAAGADGMPGDAMGAVSTTLATSPGRPMDPSTRGFFESRFGQDLGNVRIHIGAQAAASARAIQARAYTVGNDIVFQEGVFAPTTRAGRRLLAHELTHVLQQTGGGTSTGSRAAAAGRPARFAEPSRLTTPGDPAEHEAERAADAVMAGQVPVIPRLHPLAVAREGATPFVPAPASKYTPPNLPPPPLPATTSAPMPPVPASEVDPNNPWTQGTPVNQQGIVSSDEGALLRAAPSSQTKEVGLLPLNTRVFVARALTGGWYFVVNEKGQFGYVAKSHINVELPDPNARLHRIQSGETALALVKRYYKADANQWGQDERFFVNVLVLVNAEHHRKGIYKPSADASWDTTQTHENSQIWIPGVDFAKSLKGKVSSGSLTYEAYQTLKNAAIAVGEFTLGAGAFVAGLLHGALESIWDTLVGLVELVGLAGKLVWSLVTGHLLSDIMGFFEDISKLKLSDLVDAGLDWLDKKWNAPGLLSRWHFRGWIVGYAIAELVMLFFSEGILTALKGVSKVGKFGQVLQKLPRVTKLLEKAGEATKAVKEAEALKTGLKALQAARDWALKVLKVPARILADLSAEAIERLKRLPSWAIERFGELTDAVKIRLLGCASPCKVDLPAIQKYLSELAAKGASGAKKLTSVDEVLAALPEGLNISKIKPYLDKYPALMELIRKANLTDKDFVKLADFLTGADKTNPKTAYQTFTRYLTMVVPSKTGPDIKAFNEIVEAVVKADPRQGSALKGPMFEIFARTHVEEFAGKAFTRETFKTASGKSRTMDRFVPDKGEVWEVKHQLTEIVPESQANDYLALIGSKASSSGKEVKSVHYLFPTKEAADLNTHLKGLGISVWFLKPPSVLTRL